MIFNLLFCKNKIKVNSQKRKWADEKSHPVRSPVRPKKQKKRGVGGWKIIMARVCKNVGVCGSKTKLLMKKGCVLEYDSVDG